MTNTTEAPTMAAIVDLATRHDRDRADLALIVAALTDEIEETKKRYFQAIKEGVTRCAQSHAPLLEAVRNGEALFKKPKSVVVGGIRCGWAQKKRQLKVDDEALTLIMIRSILPEAAQIPLIMKKESVRLQALEALHDEDLQRLHVRIIPEVDQAFVSPVDTKVQKIVDQLVNEAIEKGGD